MNGQPVLQAPADSTGSPSGSSGGDGEQRLPAGSQVPTERNDGSHEDDADLEGREDGAVDWDNMSQEMDRDDDDTTTPPPSQTPDGDNADEDETPPPAPKPQPKPGERKPAAKPAGEETPPGKKPGEETPQGDQPKDGEQPPEGETPPAPKQETPEEKTARETREAEERQRYEQELTEYYKIPEELAARLATEPEQVLPVLASKVHMAVEQGMRNFVAQQLPVYLQHYQKITEAESRTKASFYERWPSLAKHEAQVKQVGEMYRKMNPKATPQDALEKIGALACAALGIQPDPAPSQRGNGQRPPVRPRTNGSRPVRPAARPAGVASSQAGAAPPSENLFSQYADQMLEEDQQGSDG